MRTDLLERSEADEDAERPGPGEAHPPKMRDAVEEARRQLLEQTGREVAG